MSATIRRPATRTCVLLVLFSGEQICSGFLVIDGRTKHEARHENTVNVFWKNIHSLLMFSVFYAVGI